MQITINNTLSAQDIENGKRLVNSLFRIRLLIVSAIFSLFLTGYTVHKHMKSPTSMTLLAAVVGGLFIVLLLFLLSYSLRVRPQLYRSLERGHPGTHRLVFTEQGIRIDRTPSESAVYQTDHVLGQYWHKDYYCLYLSDKHNKDFVLIRITEDSADSVQQLAYFYQEQRKRLLHLKI